jgi:hypothetical protein
MSLPEREQELLEMLDAINDAGLPYVLVGGWAVTAFNQRFSTDVDLVVPEHAVEDYDSFFRDRDYERTSEHDTSGVYEGRFIIVAARKPTPSGVGGSAQAQCDNPPTTAGPTPRYF